MRVAYFSEIFPSTSETWVHNEITELIRLGCDVKVFATWPKPEIKTPENVDLAALTEYRPEGSNLRSTFGWLSLFRPKFLFKLISSLLKDKPTPRHFAQIVRDVLMLGKLLPRIRDFQPEASVCHFAGTRANLGLMLQWIDGTPCVIKSHALDIFHGSALLPTKVKEASRFYTISKYNLGFIRKNHPRVDVNRIQVHPCGVPLAPLPFEPMRDPAVISKPTLLSVGRLVPMKGFDVLIRTSLILTQHKVDHQIIIIGYGPEESRLKDLIRELGVEDTVELLGYKTPTEVHAYLKSSSLFVMPCVWDKKAGTQDGIPVALMESMASGTLVVSTRLSGIPELIENDVSGFLADPEDSHSLFEAIQRGLSLTPQRRIDVLTAARKKIELNHDTKMLTQQLFDDLQKILGAEP